MLSSSEERPLSVQFEKVRSEGGPAREKGVVTLLLIRLGMRVLSMGVKSPRN